jgi:hypothetical protein
VAVLLLRRLRFQARPCWGDHRNVDRLALSRPEVGNDPAYGADEAVDGKGDDRDLHEPDQCPKEHDGKLAVSHFPQAQCDRVARDEQKSLY